MIRINLEQKRKQKKKKKSSLKSNCENKNMKCILSLLSEKHSAARKALNPSKQRRRTNESLKPKTRQIFAKIRTRHECAI